MTDVEPHPECRFKDEFCRANKPGTSGRWCGVCRKLFEQDRLAAGAQAPAGAGVPDPAARPRERDDRLDGAFVDAVWAAYDEAAKLLLDKHVMYSSKNISQSPGGPMNGLRVRMWDKMARLNNIIDKGLVGKEQFESVEDTLVDLANYSVIALLVLRGQWPAE